MNSLRGLEKGSAFGIIIGNHVFLAEDLKFNYRHKSSLLLGGPVAEHK